MISFWPEERSLLKTFLRFIVKAYFMEHPSGFLRWGDMSSWRSQFTWGLGVTFRKKIFGNLGKIHDENLLIPLLLVPEHWQPASVLPSRHGLVHTVIFTLITISLLHLPPCLPASLPHSYLVSFPLCCRFTVSRTCIGGCRRLHTIPMEVLVLMRAED